MTRTCLMTGGAGFIGCAVSARLVEGFERVVAIDSMHPQVHAQPGRPDALCSGVELIVGDITDVSMWDGILQVVKPDVVVHLAAETGTGQSLTNASLHAAVNVVGTTQMLDALVRHNSIPERIVVTSSRAVYGEGAWRDNVSGDLTYPGQRSRAMLERGMWDFPGKISLPFEATTVSANPTSVYGATKLAQEHIIKAWSSAFKCQPVILRLQNVYGPGQSLWNSYTGVVVLFAQIARRGEAIPVYEDGLITRDFVFVDDVAEVLARVSVKGSLSDIPYDIGSGMPIKLFELASMIAKRYDAPTPIINSRFRDGDVRHAYCNIDRARSEIGFEPRWPLVEGLNSLFNWVDQQMCRSSLA